MSLPITIRIGRVFNRIGRYLESKLDAVATLLDTEPSHLIRRTVLVLFVPLIVVLRLLSLIPLLILAAWDGIVDEWRYRAVSDLPRDVVRLSRRAWRGPEPKPIPRQVAPTLRRSGPPNDEY